MSKYSMYVSYSGFAELVEVTNLSELKKVKSLVRKRAIAQTEIRVATESEINRMSKKTFDEFAN